MTKIITNRRAGTCFACGEKVASSAGFAFTHGRGWAVSCKSTACLSRDRGLAAAATVAAAPVERKLSAAGAITFSSRPTRDELVQVKTLPGARWDPESLSWKVSTDPVDRARILEVAAKLKLAVDSGFSDARPENAADEAAFASKVAAALKRCDTTSVSGHSPYPFQRTGVEYLAARDNALIGDDMGTGKTIQALLAFPADVSALVVCPASLKFNWADECAEWRPELDVVICKGRNGWVDPKPGTLTIINYDILPAFFTPKKIDGEFDLRGKQVYKANVPDATVAALAKTHVVFDEIQKAKNFRSSRSKKVTTLAELAQSVWAATGTPLMNRPLDLWGTLSSIGLSWKVFGSWGTFLRCFGGHKNLFGGYEFTGPVGPETAERLRRVMIRRTKAEVLPELPGKTWNYLRVNGLSKSLYKRLDKLYAEWGDKSILPSFSEFSKLRYEVAESRIPAVIEFVESYEESGEPLVVFSSHRAPIDTLGEREGWVTITGNTSQKNRDAAIKSFQAGNCKGIALTISAGGEGLTLTAASNMLYVDLDWTPAMNDQAADRICRIGQTAAGLNYTVMVSDHIMDRHVTDLLISKREVISTAIDGVATTVETSDPTPKAGVSLINETEEEWADRVSGLEAAELAKQADAINERIEHADWLGREQTKPNKARVSGDLPLTAERKAAVEGAFNYLLGVCDGAIEKDGAGFNKPDSACARLLLAAGLDKPYNLKVAQLIVTRYHRQVGESFPLLFKEAS